MLLLPGAVPNNCIGLGMDNCPVDVNAKRTAAAAWWRLQRGVDCSVGNGVAGAYTIRKKYFHETVNNNADVFIQKIGLIYKPVFAALRHVFYVYIKLANRQRRHLAHTLFIL